MVSRKKKQKGKTYHNFVDDVKVLKPSKVVKSNLVDNINGTGLGSDMGFVGQEKITDFNLLKNPDDSDIVGGGGGGYVDSLGGGDDGGGVGPNPSEWAIPSNAEIDEMSCDELATYKTYFGSHSYLYQTPADKHIAFEIAFSRIHNRILTDCNVAPPPPPPPPSNLVPVAVTPASQTVKVTDGVALDGSQSYDPENGAMTFQWAIKAGPGNPQLSNADKAVATLNNLQPGSYSLELTVADALGQTDSSITNVTVEPPAASDPPPPPPPSGGGGETKGGVNPTNPVITTTGPVIVQSVGPYKGGGGAGGGAGAASPEPGGTTPAKKFNWLLWAFIIASSTYIVFGKNDK